MAVSTSSWFSNAIVGVPQIGADVNVYEEHTTPRFAIGTKFERQDGAVFRYSHFGATVDSAGYLLSTDLSESCVTMTPGVIVASSSTYQMPEEPSGVYPCMKNSKYILITKGSVTADDYAGGYITLSSGNASTGYTYRIKGNTATGTPASGIFRVDLYDKLQAGINSSTSFTIIGSKYANLEAANVASGGTDGMCAGVSMIKITTAGDFGWIQTKGICGVLAGESTILAGRGVVMSTEVAGAVDVLDIHNSGDVTNMARTLLPVVGYSCVNSTAGTFVPIVLVLE